MEAQLIINHAEAASPDVLKQLIRVFGKSDKESAIKNSTTFGLEPIQWSEMLLFAIERPRYRLFCSSTMATELQAIVEPRAGEDARVVAQSAWNGLRRALSSWSPELQIAEVRESNRPVFTAGTSAWAHLTGKETKLAVIIGVVNSIWIIIAGVSFAKNEAVNLATGGAPALITAAVFVLQALVAATRNVLQWRG